MQNKDGLRDILGKGWHSIQIMSHTVPDIDSIASLTLMKMLVETTTNAPVKVILNTDAINKLNQKKFYEVVKPYIGNTFPLPTKPGINDLIIIVDGQAGEGNMFDIEGLTESNLIVIDHHIPVMTHNTLYKEIDEKSCSCTSVIYKYVEHLESKFPIIRDIIYNGMYSDTNGFKRRLSEWDVQLRYQLEIVNPVNFEILNEIYREEYSVDDIKHLINALENYQKYRGITLAKISKCDTNVLGNIADTLASVEGNRVVIVYFDDIKQNESRISIRSCEGGVSAYEIINKITEDVGEGGGHLHACAGYIDIRKTGDTTEFLKNRINTGGIR